MASSLETGQASDPTCCRVCGSDQVYLRFRLKTFDIMKCRHCEVAYMAAVPSEQEIAALYSSDYYQKRFEYYFNNIVSNPDGGKLDSNTRSFRLALDRLQSLRPDKGRLLDLGCGLGIFLKLAREQGWDTVGVDISSYAAEYGRREFGLDIRQAARLQDAGLPAHSFDVITLWDSLEHFAAPLSQLREVSRLLRPGGVVMLDTPNEDALMRALAGLCYRATGGLWRYPVSKVYHEFHLHYFTQRSLQRLLEGAGLHVETLETKSIPIVKARGNRLEKLLVRVLSFLERRTGREYELLALARAPGPGGDSAP